MREVTDNESIIFFAIPLQAHADILQQRLWSLVELVEQAAQSPWRLIDLCRWHITVVYIGTITESLLQKIVRDMEDIHIGLHPFEIIIDDVIYLPDQGPCVAAWRVRLSDDLNELYQRMSKCIEKYGVGDIRPVYRPHISFARTKKRLTSFSPIGIQLKQPLHLIVDEVCCMQSAVVSRHQSYPKRWSQKLH